MNQQSKTSTTKKATKKATTKNATNGGGILELIDTVLLGTRHLYPGEEKAVSRNGNRVYDVDCEYHCPQTEYGQDMQFSFFGQNGEFSLLSDRKDIIEAIPTISKMCNSVGASWFFSAEIIGRIDEAPKRLKDAFNKVLYGPCRDNFFPDDDNDNVALQFASNSGEYICSGDFAKRSAAELALLFILGVDTAKAPVLTRDDVSRKKVIGAFGKLFTDKIFSGIKFSNEVIEVPHYK